jgi:hypothetical protein
MAKIETKKVSYKVVPQQPKMLPEAAKKFEDRPGGSTTGLLR